VVYPHRTAYDVGLITPQQTEATTKRRVERAEAFVAPVETAAPTVEEKRKRKRRELETEVDGDERSSEGMTRKKKGKKRRKEDGA
jgi:ribosomal RNA assembly protein